MSIRGYILTFLAIVFLASASVAARASDCPIRVSAVDLEGKGTSDHVFRYRVVLSAYSGDVSADAGLKINLGSGRPAVLMHAPHLQLKRGAAAYNDIAIFKRPAQDVSSVAVFETGTENSSIPCASGSIRVGDALKDLTGWEIPTVLAIADDSNGISPDTSWTDIIPGRTFDSRFKIKSELIYPQRAADTNASGMVRVRVTIGPAGKIGTVRVADSSGLKLLDDAAIAAATSSTYSGSVVDGIPVASEYSIVYEFVLDNGPPDSASNEQMSYCPASLNGISLATGLFGGSAIWYDVSASTIRSHVDSISLAVNGLQSPRTLLHWSPLLGEQDSSVFAQEAKNDDFHVPGALFWPGDALASGMIQDASPRMKKAVTCESAGVAVHSILNDDMLVAVAATDRPWLTAPILESVLPARFATVVWPKYDSSMRDADTPVAISVRVHVTQSGKPLVAIIGAASIAPDFAAAALAAAMASTYVVPRSPDGATLSQTFETTYVFDPAK